MQQERLAGRLGASWRGRSVGRMAGQWQTGAVRLGVAGLAIERGATELGFPGPTLGQMQGEATGRAGEPCGEEKNRLRRVLAVTTGSPSPSRAVQRARLWAITPYRVRGRLCTASQAALAAKRPEGRWLSPTPYLRSRMAFSISAWRRWSASSSRVAPPGR